jgi:hypothetical protein
LVQRAQFPVDPHFRCIRMATFPRKRRRIWFLPYIHILLIINISINLAMKDTPEDAR